MGVTTKNHNTVYMTCKQILSKQNLQNMPAAGFLQVKCPSRTVAMFSEYWYHS